MEIIVGSDGLSCNYLYMEGEGDGVGFLVDVLWMDIDGYCDYSVVCCD